MLVRRLWAPALVPFLLVPLFFAISCSESAPSGSPFTSRNPTSASSPEETRLPKTPEQTSRRNCLDYGDIQNIRSAYAANRFRAENTYVGERACFRGTISSFYETKAIDNPGSRRPASKGVVVGIGQGSEFSIKWGDWMLYVSVGDTVEAECEIARLVSTEDSTGGAPGTPGLVNCALLNTPGVTLPTPTPTPTLEPTETPVPTETPMPCVKTEYGDSQGWLIIDCPEGRVVVGRDPDSDNPDDFQFYSEGDRANISYTFWVGNTRVKPRLSQWERRTEGLEEEHGQEMGAEREVWEAPAEQATYIISEWRYSGWERLVLQIEDEWTMTFQLLDSK